MEIDYSLYLVTDRSILKDTSLKQAIEDAVKGGVTSVQLREKDISTRDFYNIALEIKTVTDFYKIPLIINDRLDIALATDAAGLHVGQSDLPAEIARKCLGARKILGVSAVTLEQALIAEKTGADYIGAGAVFPTDTKKDAKYVSLKLLKEIKNKVNIPVVAIGGINEYNIELLKDTGINGIAVVSAILGEVDITKASKQLKDRLTFIKGK
jgi:thiamine-phosphate pyrophosphorylase